MQQALKQRWREGTVDDAASQVRKPGFDGVLGFSNGAAAAFLLAVHASSDKVRHCLRRAATKVHVWTSTYILYAVFESDTCHRDFANCLWGCHTCCSELSRRGKTSKGGTLRCEIKRHVSDCNLLSMRWQPLPAEWLLCTYQRTSGMCNIASSGGLSYRICKALVSSSGSNCELSCGATS